MKVTAFVGSARKKGTYHSTLQFLKHLQSLGDIDYEIVSLSDYHLHVCRGCKQCFDKGEDHCPFQDDRDQLIGKIRHSEGVVFATPNYSFHVSGFMKIFLDRLGFMFHRPQFFGKTFTNIVYQGIYGGKKINKYLDFIGGGLGFRVVKGICLTSVEPVTEKSQRKIDRKIERLSQQFFTRLREQSYPSPSFFDMMKFRMSRTSIRRMLDENSRDYTYYRDQGWFESGYFYPVRLNPFQRLTGTIFDRLAVWTTKNDGSNGKAIASSPKTHLQKEVVDEDRPDGTGIV